jgi:hypothetical protein
VVVLEALLELEVTVLLAVAVQITILEELEYQEKVIMEALVSMAQLEAVVEQAALEVTLTTLLQFLMTVLTAVVVVVHLAPASLAQLSIMLMVEAVAVFKSTVLAVLEIQALLQQTVVVEQVEEQSKTHLAAVVLE